MEENWGYISFRKPPNGRISGFSLEGNPLNGVDEDWNVRRLFEASDFQWFFLGLCQEVAAPMKAARLERGGMTLAEVGW